MSEPTTSDIPHADVPDSTLVPTDVLRLLLRASHGAACNPDRLRWAQEKASSLLPRCGATLRVENDVPNGWGWTATCELWPGHSTRHLARGQMYEQELQWTDGPESAPPDDASHFGQKGPTDA